MLILALLVSTSLSIRFFRVIREIVFSASRVAARVDRSRARALRPLILWFVDFQVALEVCRWPDPSKKRSLF